MVFPDAQRNALWVFYLKQSLQSRVLFPHQSMFICETYKTHAAFREITVRKHAANPEKTTNTFFSFCPLRV